MKTISHLWKTGWLANKIRDMFSEKLDMTGSAPRSYIDGMSFGPKTGYGVLASLIPEPVKSNMKLCPVREILVTPEPEEATTIEKYVGNTGRIHGHPVGMTLGHDGKGNLIKVRSESLQKNPNYKQCKRCGLYLKHVDYFLHIGAKVEASNIKDLPEIPLCHKSIEESCGLHCPRTCECWEDRHPGVLAIYENPLGPKGNTDLLGEDEMILPDDDYSAKENRSNWIKIIKEGQWFKVVFNGNPQTLVLSVPSGLDFYPENQFTSGHNSKHRLNIPGVEGYFIYCDQRGNVTDITTVLNRKIEELFIPKGHQFLKFIKLTVTMDQLVNE